MKRILSSGIFAVAALFAVTALHADQPVTIALSTVGNPGNAQDTADGNAYNNATSGPEHHFGSVSYTFNIGTYDVTVSQYTAFLNAVAQTDPYSLYNTNMGTDLNIGPSISRSGSSGNYSYAVMGASGNFPITYVSWFDAARFSNWLNNGQPQTHVENATTTEEGAYSLDGDMTMGLETAVPTAEWRLPTEDEWYKAAYYDPTLNSGSGGYWAYATKSNTVPGNVVGSGINQANYNRYNIYSVTQSASYSSSQNYLTPVGAFTNSASAYGTYDQAGDVWNWNNAVISGTSRCSRGGSARNGMDNVKAAYRNPAPASQELDYVGFRVAEVPEPTSIMLMALGGILAASLRRKPLKSGIFAVVALFAGTALQADQPVTIALSTVGNPGNAADIVTANDGSGLHFGNVSYTFNIGTYDVTVSQYTAFLNAVAQTDPYSLYNTSMGTDSNIGPSISRSGSAGSYSYAVMGSSGNFPITYVNWFDAARFSNWLNNGQPQTHVENASTTEEGAYTLDGAMTGVSVSKNLLAQWYIPSENEWYKAAYYDPSLNGGLGGYWTYATRSNTAPGNVVGTGSNQTNYRYYNGSGNLYSVTQSASYSSSQNYLTPVGAFTNSASAYGTYDQAAEVLTWNDAVTSGTSRGLRGGSWGNYSNCLVSSYRSYHPSATLEDGGMGIRVANAAPEPTSLMLLGLGGILLAAKRRKPSSR